MTKILVTYATMAGSTAEVAQAIGEEIARTGLQVDVRPIGEIQGIAGYSAVVVGGPMIMGWHRGALRFLKKHRRYFQNIPLAVFVLAMSLTRTGESDVGGVDIFLDEELPRPPEDDSRMTFRERYARVSNYLSPIIKAVRPARPVSIGVFGGRLEYGRLKWWAVLFAMLVIRAPAGDRRNWTSIRTWAAGLPGAMQVERPAAGG
jgi:menaquinone-dependent protoporphyrinogen oxidase